MRKWLLGAAAAAALVFVGAKPTEAKAQVVVQFGTPVYSYAPYYGQYFTPYYQPYYRGSGLSLSFGTYPYYGYRTYPYYGSRYGWYGNYGWYRGYRGWPR